MKSISRRDALKHGGKMLAVAGAAIAAGSAMAALDGTAQAAPGAAAGAIPAAPASSERPAGRGCAARLASTAMPISTDWTPCCSFMSLLCLTRKLPIE